MDDPLHAGRVKKAEVLETERRMLVSLLVMTSWKVILGFEQEEMVDKVDVDLAIIIFIMKCYLYYDNYHWTRSTLTWWSSTTASTQGYPACLGPGATRLRKRKLSVENF